MEDSKKNIVILGAGESGVGAAILAQKQGFNVFVSDSGSIADNYRQELIKYNLLFEENGHSLNTVLNADIIVKSPGIPDSVPIIKEIAEKNIPIVSEIEFAGRYTNAFIIGITGSNGKTTTTLWTYEMLKSAGLNVGLGGNVGDSFARQVAENNYDYYVLELSSFQLDNMYDFRCNIAVLTNITPDHLGRYDYKLENYVKSKFRITQNQTSDDLFIYFMEDKLINKYKYFINGNACQKVFSLENSNADAFLSDNEIKFNGTKNIFNMIYSKLAITGKHNANNGMVAGIIADSVNIKSKVIRDVLANFKGVEHRLESFISIRGVEFINDSKATNINATWYALESMKKKIVWIVGGIDKGNDYSELDLLVARKVKAIVCLGVNNKKIVDHFKSIVPTIIEVDSMDKAITDAFYLSDNGDCVLMSPACASFDLFKNYVDRGKKFKECVRNL